MEKNTSLYWIGIKESEINCVKELFCGSITMYGSNIGNNYSYDKTYGIRLNCNGECAQWVDFVNATVEELIEKDSNCRFMQYYPADYPYYSQSVKDRIVYMNSIQLIEFLENKLMTKLWLAENATELPFIILSGNKINIENLKEYFVDYDSFVVQANESCSGSGTWLLNDKTKDALYKKIESNCFYIVTPYIQDNVSVNIHLVIYKDNFCILPPSVQIIDIENNSFTYNGADFIAFNQIETSLKQKVIEQAEVIGKQLKAFNYLGVCGIDFIVTENDVYFMEINSRFQSSTMALNLAYKDGLFRQSIHGLHIDAFEHTACSQTDMSDVPIKYSFHYYKYNEKDIDKLVYLHSLKNSIDNNDYIIFDENLNWGTNFEENAHLFEIVLKKNIISISDKMNCIIDQNIDIKSGIVADKSILNNLIALKIMLLNHGIRITESAEEYSKNNGGLNHEEFSAVDMKICGKYISVPYKSKNTEFSPFSVDINEKSEYILRYFGQYITGIELRKQNNIGFECVGDGFLCNDIIYLGNDRLRIYYKNGCFFKECDIGCKFCDIEKADHDFSWEEIKSAMDMYWDKNEINHYLIGGGSDSINTDFSKVIKIANYIRMHNDKPIMIMTLPPQNLDVLTELKSAGITEVMFNIEIFDRATARKYMPGKGEISIGTYLRALKKSVEIFGSNGHVRTMFIIGLESEKSLLEGIETVCKLGVYPTLSLFKPIEGTPMEHKLPPTNKELYALYNKIMEICHKYNVSLGPNCKYCEDNVLKI